MRQGIDLYIHEQVDSAARYISIHGQVDSAARHISIHGQVDSAARYIAIQGHVDSTAKYLSICLSIYLYTDKYRQCGMLSIYTRAGR